MAKAKAKYEMRVMPVDAVRPADYNPRVALRPGDPDYEKLKDSLRDLELIEPLVWNETTGNLVGGHQRLQVMKDLGHTEVPVFVVHLSEEKEKHANLALNRISGRWDETNLRAVIDSLDPSVVRLAGFDAKDLRELYADGKEDLKEDNFDLDDALQRHAEPITKPGDVIVLGRHRLMCGDATNPADAEILFDGQKASMVFTDPPYNVNYEGGNGKKIMNDHMEDSRFFDFLLQSFRVQFEHLEKGGGVYICHADSEGLNFREAMAGAGFLMKQCLIWVKNSLVLGRQDYQWQHEPILYGWKPGASHRWYGDRKQTTTLNPGEPVTVQKEKDGTYTLSFMSGYSCLKINVPDYKVTGRSEDGSVWLFDKPKVSKEHPTMKPVSLCGRAIVNSSGRAIVNSSGRAIVNSSGRGDIVSDPFGGSGSTLIAAEQLGRRCYMMELDPVYCDVIIDRYHKLESGGGTLP